MHNLWLLCNIEFRFKLTFYFSSLCRATHVPVGDDQLQHLELARDIARSFNNTYGETFPEPKPLPGLLSMFCYSCALTLLSFSSFIFSLSLNRYHSLFLSVSLLLSMPLPLLLSSPCLPLSLHLSLSLYPFPSSPLPLSPSLSVSPLGEVQRVMSLRNPLQKMSKSDNQESSRINLTDSPDVIRQKIRKAVTDSTSAVTFEPSERPGVSNLVSIYGALAELNHNEVCERFEGKQTVDLKDELAELLVEKLQPICQRISELEGEPGYIDQVLKDGADKAKSIATENLDGIMRLMGLL